MSEDKEVKLNVKKNKLLRTAKVSNFNIGVIVLFLVFVYLVVNVIVALNKEHLAIYEVQAVSMAHDNNAEAVLIRKEENYYTETSGYTNFYVRSGSRVSVGDTIYSIDESKNIYEYLKDYEVNYTLSGDDVDSIKSYVRSFNNHYTSDSFNMVYDLDADIRAEMANIADSFLLNNLNDIIAHTGNSVTFSVVTCPTSGIVSLFSDSLDGLTADMVGAETFNKENYKANNLYDTNLKTNNTLIYKLISDDNWSMVIRMNEEQYNQLSTRSNISFTIKNDGLHMVKPAQFYTKDGEYFCRVDLNNYMIRYVKERFLDIELDIQTEDGLKIPYTSLTTKEFYKIPIEYYVTHDDKYFGFTYMHYNVETKETTYEFIETPCYFRDYENGFVYVNPDDIDYGQYLYSMENETLYQVSVIENLRGVFNVNKGYAIFRRVDMISENDDYCIIANGSDSSLSAHDHIVLNSKYINENIQIY